VRGGVMEKPFAEIRESRPSGEERLLLVGPGGNDVGAGSAEAVHWTVGPVRHGGSVLSGEGKSKAAPGRRTPKNRRRWLGEAVGAAAEEFEEAEVAEDLELLADFGQYVTIVRMKLG